jgi:hypothetical protein
MEPMKTMHSRLWLLVQHFKAFSRWVGACRSVKACSHGADKKLLSSLQVLEALGN